jgi:nucleotide-binding universal stress UspA family protein
MTALRSLLVHLDASERSLARLRLAHALSNAPAAAGARVAAMYSVVPLALQHAYGSMGGAASAFALLSDLDAQRRDSMRRLFERERGDGDSALTWADLGNEALIPGFVAQALCADAMVLGQTNPEDAETGVPSDFVASVLLASGKPALVVPYAGDHSSVGDNVLIAWKPSRESARAVSSALPLLQHARQVHLALSRDSSTQATGLPGRLDILGWLRSHGIEPNLLRPAVADDSPGESLLSTASDLDADLLVMGCYGHGRTREWVMGGATRTLLTTMTLPVWMAH